MKKLFLTLLSAIAVFSVRADIILAENGKSYYRIVAQPTASEMEKLAVADLAKYLKQITGADFTGQDAKHAIYIGRRAPSDKEPLKANERRIRSENGDIYIYGEGPYGNSFAIYDFLEEFLGCHWYTLRGKERIPKNPSPVLKDLDFSRIPSFHHPYIYGGTYIPAKAQLRDYTRRNRIFALTPGITQIGPRYGHVPGQLVPPGKKYKKHVFIWRPYKYFRKEAWFDEHPEFFSMDPKGKRVPDVQLCYSNPELRKLLESKLEMIIAKEYRGGTVYIRCDLNDNNGFDGKTICCCKNCMALVEKYKSPAGPYWDFVLDLCARWKTKYPSVVLANGAYRVTAKIPAVGRIPANLAVSYCPLGRNFNKPFDHPANRGRYESIKRWAAVCDNLWVQLYPSIYPRATTALPLLANLRQIAQNLRVCKRLGVKKINLEQGHTWGVLGGFNELRQYLLARMLNNVELDENKLIEEAMRDIYGKAADLMIAYWKELEELEAKEEIGLQWDGLNYGSFSYLTGENLARWSRAFDKMEELVADDPEALRYVRDARFNLDEAILSVWHRMPKTPEFDRTRVFVDGIDSLFAARLQEGSNESDLANLRNRLCARFLGNGLEYFYAVSGTPGPLPPGIEKKYPGPIHRVLPHRRLAHLTESTRQLCDDPKAPYGVALRSNRGKWKKPFLFFRVMYVFYPDGKTRKIIFNDAATIKFSDVQKHRGEYRLYFCGRTRLYPQSLIYMGGLDRLGWVLVGQCWDPKNPDAEYDVYLSVKVDEDGVLWFGEVVLCGTGRSCPEQKDVDISAAG